MIGHITKIYTRRYSDTGQVVTYVEWVDKRGNEGRTEGSAYNDHMKALLARGYRSGLHMEWQEG